MLPRKCKEPALKLIRESEGVRLTAYLDTGGVLTIGYGHTGRDVKRGMKITKDEADRLLRADVYEAEETIQRNIKADVIESLPDDAYDALVDTAFNLGNQLFVNKNGSRTGIARALDARRFDEVPAQLKRWVYDNGVRLEGLVRRREKAAALWVAGFKGGQ